MCVCVCVCGVHACVFVVEHFLLLSLQARRGSHVESNSYLVKTRPAVMSVSDFAAFVRGSICSSFIDSVPLIKIARATSMKMAGVPPLSKAELLKVRELDAKP